MDERDYAELNREQLPSKKEKHVCKCQSEQANILAYQKILRMLNVPELIVLNPMFIDGQQVDEKDMLWAKSVIKQRKEWADIQKPLNEEIIKLEKLLKNYYLNNNERTEKNSVS